MGNMPLSLNTYLLNNNNETAAPLNARIEAKFGEIFVAVNSLITNKRVKSNKLIAKLKNLGKEYQT